MAAPAPPPANLDNARYREDPLVRELVTRVSQQAGGPTAYNRLLMGLDWLQRAPELLYREDSHLTETLRTWPPELRAYFAPAPLPDWVDPDKLARASEIWDENSVSLLFVLFAASLPSCYLLHRGIPALYRTGKLAKREYLAQRLYETGLMVDAVLDADGLVIVEDHADSHRNLMSMALRESNLEDAWAWVPERHAFVRRDGQPAPMEEADRKRLGGALQTLVRLATGKKFLWGRGLVVSRKVRFLHGYMRAMLMRPDPAPGVPAWDTAKLGLPVNQEDQAYTLLTFGYVMMVSLDQLGLRLSREDREAFLHRWRVVGHLMGIEDGLMTDDWDAAASLFRTIRDREGGRSEEGERLTSTLLEFLSRMLPDRFGIGTHLPVQFVAHFLGPQADQLLSGDYQRLRRSLAGRLLFHATRGAIRLYYVVRACWKSLVPGIPSAVTREMHILAEELIESCWSAFERAPFYLPQDLTTWRRDPDATEAFLRRIRAWQLRLFDTVLLSVGLWIAAGLLLFAAAGFAAFTLWKPAALAGVAGVACGWGYGAVGRWWVTAIRSQRPVPPDSPVPPGGNGKAPRPDPSFSFPSR